MKNVGLKNIAEFIGMGAIVASLVFVGLQVRQDQEIALAQISYDGSASLLDWTTLLNENHDVWIRGLRAEDLGENDQMRFDSLAMAYFSWEFTRWMGRDLLAPGPAEVVLLEAAHFIAFYPGLRTAWEKRARFRLAAAGGREPGPFMQGINEVLAELDSGERERVIIDSFSPM